MYNYASAYAAAFSESYKKACDSNPMTAGGGQHYGTCGPYGSATVRGRCPHTARVDGSENPWGGDTRPRSRNAGQLMTGSRWVSPSGYVHRQIDSAKDERNLKPPLQGPQARKACNSDPSAGGSGQRYDNCGPRSATVQGLCPHSARVESGNPRGGDTRPRSRNAGQPMTGSQRVSPSGYVHRQIDSAKDERNLKPPLQGPQARRLSPLRRLPQRNKVRPLNIDGLLLTSEARPPCPSDSARSYAMFNASSQISNTTQRSGNLVVAGQSRKLANITSDRTSSSHPEDDIDRPPSVVVGQAFVPTTSRSKRTWKTRLRSLFAPRSRGTKTTVQPFVTPQGQSEGQVSRPRSLEEDHSDPGQVNRPRSLKEDHSDPGQVSQPRSLKEDHSDPGQVSRPRSLKEDHSDPGQVSQPRSLKEDHSDPGQVSRPRSLKEDHSDPGQVSRPMPLKEDHSDPGQVNRSRSLKEDHSDPGHQSHTSALMKNREAKGFGGDALSIKMHHRQCSAAMATRPASYSNQPLPIPGTPQFDWDRLQSSSHPAPRSDNLITSQKQKEVTSLVANYGDGSLPASTPRNASFRNSSVCNLPSFPSQRQGAKMRDKISSDEEVAIPNADPLTSISRGDGKPHEEGRESGDHGGGWESISIPVSPSPSHQSVSSTSRNSSPSQNVGSETDVEDFIYNVDGESSSVSSMSDSSWAMPNSEADVDVDSFDEETIADKSRQRFTKLPPLRQQRLALKIAPAFALKTSYPEDFAHWLTVVLSCIERRDVMRRMQLASNYKTPFTRKEAWEIHANAAKAKDIMRQLNQIISLSTKDEESSIESLQLASPANPVKKDSEIEGDRRTSNATPQFPKDAWSSREVASSKDSESSASITAKTKFETTLKEHKEKVEKSDSDQEEVTPAECPESSISKLSEMMSTESKPWDVVNKASPCAHLPTISKKSSSNDASRAASHAQKDILSLAEAASENGAEYTSSINAQKYIVYAQTEMEETPRKPQKTEKSDSDRPSGSPVSLLPKLSNKTPTSASLGKVVNKASFEENYHSPQRKISKNSSLKDAATTDNTSSTANASSTNPQVTQSPQEGLPELTAYPSIDPSELEFIMSDNGKEVALGSGSCGGVLLMRHKGDNTLLAVKVLVKNFSFLQHEVAAMHAVRNCLFFPKFVGVIDYCSYAQELVGGVGRNTAYDFRKALHDDLLNALEWLHVCRDVTKGLKALHTAGWLHCDLHCGNAMVCPNPPGSDVAWRGKIIDLGNALQISNPGPVTILDDEQQKKLYELAKQCAPEILEGRDTFTEKSDIYSLGNLFVDVASDANIPHGLRLLGEFCMRRSSDARPTLDAISGKLDDFISEMMQAEQQPSSPSPIPPSSSSPSPNLRCHLIAETVQAQQQPSSPSPIPPSPSSPSPKMRCRLC
ncbi:uncharacterized protein LOC119740251 [Patiria miniata]|uniref:Protein kinase domain-containing protein n=1 Tax=Patiria miniata TaxID=46514 RepID=A0A914B6J8_PATMI|nr:uncharacterized protein LOC119740251 [Patiria miniata]